MMKTWLAAGAVALTLGMNISVQAAPVTQPGEQVGLAYGPLPEGVYAINTFSTGRGDARNAPDVGVNIPILVWSTGYKVLGATLMPVIAVPTVFVGHEQSGRHPQPGPELLLQSLHRQHLRLGPRQQDQCRLPRRRLCRRRRPRFALQRRPHRHRLYTGTVESRRNLDPKHRRHFVHRGRLQPHRCPDPHPPGRRRSPLRWPDRCHSWPSSELRRPLHRLDRHQDLRQVRDRRCGLRLH